MTKITYRDLPVKLLHTKRSNCLDHKRHRKRPIHKDLPVKIHTKRSNCLDHKRHRNRPIYRDLPVKLHQKRSNCLDHERHRNRPIYRDLPVKLHPKCSNPAIEVRAEVLKGMIIIKIYMKYIIYDFF
jgi:hypothetical protein